MKNLTIPYIKINDAILNKVVIDISQAFPIRYIICWGMTTDHEELISCFADARERTQKHFFLLVITNETSPTDQEVQQYVDRRYVTEQVNITVVSHSVSYVNNEISNGGRFFSKVCKFGCLMYSSDGLQMQIAQPNVVNDKTLAIAEQHFEHRFHMAEGFLLAAEQSLDGGYHNHAVFFLHQCTEQACIALIQVFLGYWPEQRNLRRLLDLCASFSNEPKAIFTGCGNEKLFQLMQNSDVDARYKEGYQLAGTEPEDLYQLVHKFVELAEALCKEWLMEDQNFGVTEI